MSLVGSLVSPAESSVSPIQTDVAPKYPCTLQEGTLMVHMRYTSEFWFQKALAVVSCHRFCWSRSPPPWGSCEPGCMLLANYIYTHIIPPGRYNYCHRTMRVMYPTTNTLDTALLSKILTVARMFGELQASVYNPNRGPLVCAPHPECSYTHCILHTRQVRILTPRRNNEEQGNGPN